MEELFESEVLWPESHQRPNGTTAAISVGVPLKRAQSRRASAEAAAAASAPMDIPRTKCLHSLEGGGDCELEGEMVPPHILASRRRMNGQVAFSLCSGQGRTLKGRDLRHVRNSVLRMTGFLEG